MCFWTMSISMKLGYGFYCLCWKNIFCFILNPCSFQIICSKKKQFCFKIFEQPFLICLLAKQTFLRLFGCQSWSFLRLNYVTLYRMIEERREKGLHLPCYLLLLFYWRESYWQIQCDVWFCRKVHVMMSGLLSKIIHWFGNYVVSSTSLSLPL